jgi:hypothetical protein
MYNLYVVAGDTMYATNTHILAEKGTENEKDVAFGSTEVNSFIN